MKIIKATILTTLLATSLFAAEDGTSKLAADMRTMLNAVNNIQTAGFYNNKTGVIDATNKLVTSLDSLITTDAKEYLPDDVKDAGKFAKKREKMIKLYANDLIESLKEDNYDDAIEDYAQLLRQCTSCHSRIRKRAWK